MVRPNKTGALAWLPELCWLVVVWVLLWGSVSPLVPLTGIAIAAAALWTARLPRPAPLTGRLRPVRLLVYVGDLVGELFSSAVQVSWQAIRYGGPAGGALVSVPIRAHSGGLLLVTANSVSLTPGNVAVELDRENGRLFVHGFPIRSEREVEDLRRFVVRIEARVIRAVGSPQDLRAIEQEEKRR
ncbi:MAG: Na+/H+ antiporter subunit E [Streptosporangiales bacterium]|nr:Na+/H+ antiporter subunit E [Streptosporangiales bacterium]